MTRLGAIPDWRTNDEVIAEHLCLDPEFRAEWERTSVVRAVAMALVRYRADHDLSQRALAERLQMKRAALAELELGESDSSAEMIARIRAQLQMAL